MDISNLHDLFLGYLFPWIPKVASIWHWITGLILVVAILKLLIGGALRVYTIYRERGLGWWMVGALWDTAFAILRIPSQSPRPPSTLLSLPWTITLTKAATGAQART